MSGNKSRVLHLLRYLHTDSDEKHVISTKEIKILIDAVSASHFIPSRQSRDLIEKLMGFESKYKADEYTRHLYFADSTKTTNKGAFYLVDKINDAINVSA